uniref:Uncharacterized protein n=1 Tax=Brassica oleracea var. oleracea TaxID=109376 RepID=A0A0D3DB70_BRAOL
MSSSSSNGVDARLNEAFEEMFDQQFDHTFDSIVDVQANKPKRRAYIERDREQRHNLLWNDHFREHPTYPPEMFRWRFRMNKPLFLRIVDRLSNEVPYFEQRKNAHGRDDRQDRLYALGVEKLPNGLERAVHTWFRKADNCLRGCGTLNDINVIDRSPVFDDILQGRAPKVNFKVNVHNHRMAYYLTNRIYPKWSTFIQSILLPQGPKAELFAERQESAKNDVERAFGVLQSRERTRRITQYDTSDFVAGESSRSSQVDFSYSTDTPSNIGNMLGIRNQIRDQQIHDRLKADLVENIRQRFGNLDE